MALFSRKDTRGKHPGVPPQIFSAVSVMGDKARPDDIEAPPASPGSAPFVPASTAQQANTPEKAFPPAPSGQSPFLAEAPSTQAPQANPFGTPAAVPASADFLEQRPAAGAAGLIPQKKTRPLSFWLLIGGVIFLTLILMGGIGYYFLGDRLSQTRNGGENPLAEPQPASPEPAPVQPPALAYSLSSANYLPVDTESDTAESIRQKLAEAGSKISSAQAAKPIEFVVTDQNNNPLAFSRFAYLLGLSLSDEILTSLDEPFSLYIENDGGPRYGLALAFKDPATAQALLQENEAALPAGFRSVLYPADVAVPTAAAFRSGAYGALNLRYANIDSDRNFSFDYALQGSDWLIGSSKNTLRAVLDKRAAVNQ